MFFYLRVLQSVPVIRLSDAAAGPKINVDAGFEMETVGRLRAVITVYRAQ